MKRIIKINMIIETDSDHFMMTLEIIKMIERAGGQIRIITEQELKNTRIIEAKYEPKRF